MYFCDGCGWQGETPVRKRRKIGGRLHDICSRCGAWPLSYLPTPTKKGENKDGGTPR